MVQNEKICNTLSVICFNLLYIIELTISFKFITISYNLLNDTNNTNYTLTKLNSTHLQFHKII